jgi:5-methylcytosine-specific restriction protein A
MWTGRTLPSNWPTLRRMVATRAGGQCQWVDEQGRCTNAGSECDHIEDRDNHDPSNLQWLCAEHHRMKTIAQAAAARARRGTINRPKRPHPGRLR